MSDFGRVGLVGSTGMIGREVMEATIGRPHVRLVAMARREVPLPRGVRMEMRLAPIELWGEVLRDVRPASLICALGTTWKKAGENEERFRAVDHKLVVAVATAALEAGVPHFLFASSVGADTSSKNRYLRVKGETERDLAKLKFRRLDILRPGLLRGKREEDPRVLERLGMLTSPLWNLALHGDKRKYRAVNARDVAEAALMLTKEKAAGRFIHEHDSIMRMAKRFKD